MGNYKYIYTDNSLHALRFSRAWINLCLSWKAGWKIQGLDGHGGYKDAQIRAEYGNNL